jgi:hypothetical protein
VPPCDVCRAFYLGDDGLDPGDRRFADHPTGKLCARDAAVAEYRASRKRAVDVEHGQTRGRPAAAGRAVHLTVSEHSDVTVSVHPGHAVYVTQLRLLGTGACAIA